MLSYRLQAIVSDGFHPTASIYTREFLVEEEPQHFFETVWLLGNNDSLPEQQQLTYSIVLGDFAAAQVYAPDLSEKEMEMLYQEFDLFLEKLKKRSDLTENNRKWIIWAEEEIRNRNAPSLID